MKQGSKPVNSIDPMLPVFAEQSHQLPVSHQTITESDFSDRLYTLMIKVSIYYLSIYPIFIYYLFMWGEYIVYN